MNRRLKVLISAYACSPIRGSEPGMGWGFVEAISKYHDLWVITEEEKFRSEIEQELSRRPQLNDRIKFFYLKKNRHRTLRKIWPPSYYWFYKAWQKRAYALAYELCKEVPFDLVHQLNMAGFREPGYLWKLDLPFVWGPIGGLENTPWRLLPALGPRGCVYYACRNVLNSLHRRCLVRCRKAFAKAAVPGGIIAATKGIQAEIQRVYGHESRVICEVGLYPQVRASYTERQSDDALKIAWSGTHTSGKALPLLLQATALLPRRIDWQLHILGHGPCTAEWKRLVDRLRVGQRCTWYGWLPKKDALEVMRSMHIFVITSVKDLTSTVSIEALSQGLPVICLDHCGFSDVVNDKCGIKIPLSNYKQVIFDIARAVEQLCNNEPYRKQLANGASHRAAEYSWDKKGAAISEIYQRVAAADIRVRLDENTFCPQCIR